MQFESISRYNASTDATSNVEAFSKKCATNAPTSNELKSTVQAHNSEQKMALFNVVKIRTHNNDVSKRWYCEYHTDKGRKRIYGNVNREHNPEIRYNLLQQLKAKIEENLFLPKGASKPIEFNSDTYTTSDIIALSLDKKKYLKKNSLHALDMSSRKFISYLSQINKHRNPAHLINKKDIEAFKDWMVESKLSNRSVNNYIKSLRTIYNFIMEQYPDVITINPAKGVKLFPTISTSHEIYTDKQVQAITDYFREKNQHFMHLFCSFIIYTFLRPNEVRNIQIKHIDLVSQTITIPSFNSKTNKTRVREMHQNLVNSLLQLNLDRYPQSFYLFGNDELPNKVPCSKNYPLRRFEKLRKVLHLRPEQTMYSLRHTFVCMMLRQGFPHLRIMGLTGHKTLEAFESYAKQIYTEPGDLTIYDKLPVIF